MNKELRNEFINLALQVIDKYPEKELILYCHSTITIDFYSFKDKDWQRIECYAHRNEHSFKKQINKLKELLKDNHENT